jgi:hypothetical protein
LTGSRATEAADPVGVAGFRPFSSSTPQLVTNEQVNAIRDQDGL